MLCTEAVLVALNEGLGGGLTENQAIAMAAPFCVALGDSGCVCGALSGAILSTGLLLGKDHPYLKRKGLRESARCLHDTFKAENGATCCRVLSRKVKDDKKTHFLRCAELTAQGAEMAAKLVLEKRPDIIQKAGKEFIAKNDSRFRGLFLRILKPVIH